ncbi:sensor histidine kinase [Brachybacterium sp. AOP3-A1-3]|uniref:sensor histidine kinase n=1 Tax=Brachybacterium sp. AOP3-A1-3 TaxID=3457699 RepID=UPI0040333C08
MSARPGLPHLRDVLLAVPVGLLVLVSLRAAGHWGSGSGPGGGWGPGNDGGPGSGWNGADGGGGPWNWVSSTAPDGWAYLLAGLAVLAVALRRWPISAFALATGATSLFLALGNSFGPILVTVLVSAFALARRAPLPRSAIAAGIGILLLPAHALVAASPMAALTALVSALPVTAWVVVPYCIGLARRLTLENRARRREQRERTALDAERLRLASEVHDVVGHGLAAIQMQADIALHVAERRPEQAREALQVISRASAEALAELRATLAAVAPDAASADSHAPTPGIDRLEALCARMREAGIDVELTVTGERRPVEAAVDVAAYRIVQESLTNVVKHAAERRARVHLTYREREVELSVINAAPPLADFREGFGIAGIRRRTADVGGRVEIAADDGTFAVRAVLPG